MKEIIRKIYYAIIKRMPAKWVINIENFKTYKRFLNESNPEYFGEKIQWLKLYGNLEKYSDYVDKYVVRDYIKQTIGEEYLIPLIGVYSNSSEIDYSKLPEKFVLKINNGSGFNIIVKDKDKLNIKKTNKKLDKWMSNKYYKIKKENQYKNVKNKIICEEFINDKQGQLLDYKFFCFDGKPEFVKIDFDRFTDHKVNFYDMKWNKIDLREFGYDNYNGNVEKPANFEEMIYIVEKLAAQFNFIRVDLYNVDGKIYFGELTFTPASGRHAFLPLEMDKKIAEGIKI
ncbi:MAG: glycosyltransferase [Clostridia bacterium]|nr:glycosyltransferase [Clostridia bacterium]